MEWFLYDSGLHHERVKTLFRFFKKSFVSDMKDIFAPTNLIKEPNCFKSQNSTLFDLILTSRPKSFTKSENFETDLSDCHKLFCSILRASSRSFLLKL